VTSRGISLRYLVFTGPDSAPAKLTFVDGLNIVFGASDTGKSFIVKAISYMIGAVSKLPKIEEREGYDGAWLGLALPGGHEITLYRATKGGGVRLHDGLVTAAEEGAGILLSIADAKKTETVSHYLLDAIGLADKFVVKNAGGEKDKLSIRLLAPLVLVLEGAIMSERSPILYSGQHTAVTFEKNLLRLLLTGQDDSAVQPTMTQKTRKVVTTAKVELVDEMIAQIDQELGEAEIDRSELRQQIERIDHSLQSMYEMLTGAQNDIDRLVSERRIKSDTKLEFSARLAELEITLLRFASLDSVYRSDIARLEALEEGGFILKAMTGQDCAVCGAPPSAQRHDHAADEIERSHRAAAAEARKIQREQRDLARTVKSLTAEAAGLRAAINDLARALDTIEQSIADARPREAAARTDYELFSSKKSDLDRIDSLFARRDSLVVKRAQIEEKPPKKIQDKMFVGIDGTVAYAFGKTVRQVLEAWRFPNAEHALFDVQTSDVTIVGKERADSGKGVRAILHAAVNVATLIFCRERGLPHPGFLVLDTPLLTYREPLTSKYGELSEDEAEIKRTSLATHFYNHLASLEGLGQIIIIENSDPPSDLDKPANIEIFTGRRDSGRFGLFVAKATLASTT
jgi:peptidoglycan hydrolase CwlO-like protein